jgi:thiol-disulfide isomerase/thioredoxin
MGEPSKGAPPPVILGPNDFHGARLDRFGMWVVAFLADWCPFCRSFGPRLFAISGQGFEVAWADVSRADSPLWDVFEIEVIPTVIIFRNGSVVLRVDGRFGEGLDTPDLAEILRAAVG